MKRFTAMLLIISVIMLSFPFYANAQNSISKETLGSTDTSYSFDSESGVLTIYGSGATPDYDFSNQPWFEFRNSVESIVVENGVTKLGTNSFRHFNNCLSVSLPSTLTSIGDYAFFDVSSISSIMIDASVSYIGNFAFAGASKLNAVYFEDMTSTVSLGVGAFVQCPKLTSAAFPINTVFGQYSCGFVDEDGILQNGFVLHGMNNTAAYYYANSSGITFTNDIPLYYGTTFGNVFSQYTDENWYSFTPDYSGDYNFYSLGSIDTYVTVYDSTKTTVLFENDDKSYQDLNFDLTANLIKGSQYYFKVTNVHSIGKYTCYIAPTDIESITATLPNNLLLFEDKDSQYAIDDSGNTFSYYDMSPYYDMITITVTYNSGYVDTFCYNEKDYFGKSFEINDNQLEAHWGNGINYITLIYSDIETDVAVNVHVHNYVLNHTPSSCTEDGEDLYTCSCGDSYSTVIKALGHNADIKYISPTCTEGGYYYDYCTRCGIHLSDTTELLPIGHLYKIITHTQPSATEAGITVYQCVNCGDTYTVYTYSHTISGKIVVMESPDGSHPNNIKYSCDIIENHNIVGDVDNGCFSFTLTDGEHTLKFENTTGPDRYINVTINGSNIDMGIIALVPYDFNDDGIITARDYALFNHMIGATSDDDGFETIYDFNGNGMYDKDDIKGIVNYYTYGNIDSSVYDDIE